MAHTIDHNYNITSSIGERKVAEAKSMFETEPQKKKRLLKQFQDNADKVLRPKKA